MVQAARPHLQIAMVLYELLKDNDGMVLIKHAAAKLQHNKMIVVLDDVAVVIS